MKDAFVASDAGAVAREANSLADKMNSLNAASLGSMEKAHFDKTVELLRKISGSKVLQDQRAFFVYLNQQMVAIASHLDLSRTLYVQLCPMANNNQGAIWLSAEEEIRNPYYGDEMLSCGKIEQVLN
jgi:Cu(I)/Ag(I) efflux system membrane fusion protein